MRKKLISWIAGVMVLALAACGKGEEQITSSKNYVYKSEEIPLEELGEMSSLGRFYIQNDRMYFNSYEWKEEGGATMSLISKNMDGSDVKVIQLETGNNQNYTHEAPDGEGGYYVVLNEYISDESNPNQVLYEENYFLMHLGENGSETWKIPLNTDIAEGEGYWIQWMKLLPDERIALMDSKGLHLYQGNGSLIKTVQLRTENESNDIYQLTNGELVVYGYDTTSNTYMLNKLNVDTGELSGNYVIPGNSGSYSLYTGAGYDFYLIGNNKIFGYNLGAKEITPLMDFIDSDMSSPYVHSLSAVSEKELYAVSNDESTGENVLLKLTKVAPEDVVEKIILTLACYGLDWDIRRQIVDFNKSNTEYRIQITDYSQFDTEEDYSAGLTKLNTDLASGNVPDILLPNAQLPMASYVAKGLFEDLYPYIDGDQELERDNFFSNILSAYETDGKLYRLVPSFTINTVVGKTADVGAESGWTLEDLEAVMKKKPQGTQYFDGMTRSGILRYSIQMTGEEFIDWDSGKCSFDSEGFIRLLEFAAQFPEELGDDFYNEDYWNNSDSLWRNGKVLLMGFYLDSFSSYNMTKKGTFGEEITLIGFPSQEGKGAAISSGMELAMSSKSKHKEGAWQFLRHFLMEEYQEKIPYGLPLSKKRVEALGKEAMKKPTYEDETGAMVEYDQTHYVGGQEIVITPMSQKEVDEVIAYISSIDQIYTYDMELVNIIEEEAAHYFAGQKKVEEVAGIIQSRIQIYVNENR